MSVIIRLQNLPWSANAADIRQYFRGLSIPEGGVHIVGGEKGDAFISFSTDEDARQAMLSDGGCIKDIQIRLLLSSRNEMQKVIETARQQSIQITQVYMQQMQQPQLPLVGSLPPLTAKVLPQPQQQPPRPNQLVGMLQRHHPIMDAATVLMSQEKQQQQLQQQQSQHQHMSPKPAEIKDRDDKPGGYKRERTRSKSREHRSKSSRSSGGSNRRDRSKSRDRRRRDRSRGRDRSRDRYRNDGRNRNSSSRGSGGKSHRSRSPVTKAADGAGKGMIADQQPPSARTWNGQYDNNVLQQHQTMADNHQPPVMNAGPHGNVGTMFNQFRTPPQPPIVPVLAANPYQQQHQPVNNEWGAGNDGRQQPYAPNNDFRGESYGGGSDDEDDRQAEFDNNYHRRFNDNSNNAAARRGRPGQDFHDQQGFNGPNRNPRFNKPPQQSMAGGQQHHRGGGHHRQFDGFGGAGGGPRFNHHQQHPRYGGGNSGGPNVADSNGGGGRPSRFSSIQDGGGGNKPSRFNPVPQQQQHRGRDEDGAGGGDGSDFNDPKRPATGTPRFNDRYRYDVRNAQAGPRIEGLCVEVNNMTSHFSYGDVRKVFEGIHIDGSAIKIQKHRQGVAFVRFDSNYNKNLAMRVNGNAYKGNNVVVKHLDDEAYERENTDDRPYPAAAAAPNVVDLVDLVDDEDDNEGTKDGTKHSDDDSNKLVVCEKNASAAEGGSDGGEAQQSSSVTSQQPQQSQQQQPSQQPQQQQNVPTKYLKLKQLPITVTEENVLNEMDGGGEVRRVTFYPDGEFLGALLEFRSVDEAEATLKRFDCVLLGSTPVPVLRCTYKEYVQIKRKTGGGTRRFSGENTGGSVGGGGGGGGRHYNQHHNPVSAQPNAGPTGGNRSNCLYVHGLPTSVTNTDITQFFADSTALPDKIHIMLSKFGRPTGESYCEFSSPQQAHAALVKDQCYMGPNLVYVVPINRSDMIQAITKPMQQHHQDMSWGPGGGAGGNRGGGGGGGPRQHNMMSGPRQQHQGPQSSYGGGRGGGYGGGGRPQPYMNNARGGGGGGGYTPRMRGPGPNAGPNTGPDGFGQPGCVVALDNVPYRAEVQEIVDFFEGFDLNSQNVIRRFNDFGKPTGEARVNLRNPQEAMRAVRVLQNKPIYNRPVCLTLL